MRVAATFLSLIALMLATGAVFRMPQKEVPRVLEIALIAQILYTLGPWIAMQRFKPDTRAYLYIIEALGSLALLSTVAFTVYAAASLVGWIIASTIVLVAPISFFLGRFLFEEKALQYLTCQSFLFIVCGGLVLLSIVVPGGATWDAARKALCAFWIFQGIFHWFLAFGIDQNHYMRWMVRASWMPATIALIAFCWLALKLNNFQREAAREVTPAMNSLEHRQPAPAFLRHRHKQTS